VKVMMLRLVLAFPLTERFDPAQRLANISRTSRTWTAWRVSLGHSSSLTVPFERLLNCSNWCYNRWVGKELCSKTNFLPWDKLTYTKRGL